MPTSANGWSANDRSVIASYSLPGGKIALRKGDVSVVLLWCANQWHTTVEPLVWPGNWGYAERTIRGSSTTLSNHASGTAIDCNAPQHPLGTRPSANFTAIEIQAIRRILAYCEGAIRWGGDYNGRPDGMHLEVNTNAAGIGRIADKIRAGAKPTIPLIPDSGAPGMQWNDLVPDYYTENPNDRMWASECLAWGTTHAAHARDAARSTLAKVTTLESKVDALSARIVSGQTASPNSPTSPAPVALTDADVDRIANRVLDLLSKRTAA